MLSVFEIVQGWHQARYLMRWLQERGALIPFVHALRTSLRTDPTGWAALTAALHEGTTERDMAAFQERWEAWVLGLRFP